jgi:hypothetical protein
VELSRVRLEQPFSPSYSLTGRDEHACDTAGQRRADPDVFGIAAGEEITSITR